MKIIKLMPDYQCFPIWDMTPGEYGDIDPAALPISNLLQRQLMGWAKAYDETLNLDDPANSGFSSVNEKNAFEAEGFRLAAQLSVELGSQFEVQEKIRAFTRREESEFKR